MIVPGSVVLVRVTLNDATLRIPCRVEEVKPGYGRFRYRVTPRDGPDAGKRFSWVDESRIEQATPATAG